MNQRTIRLQKMDTALARGLSVPGNDFIQRQVLEEIIRNAYFASEPVLNYLVKKLQSEPEFKCTRSECADTAPFKNQMALNGHMKKHATSNPSIQS
jgi:hypothetical protein